MSKIFIGLIVLTIHIFFTPTVIAQEYYFQEEFNLERAGNTLDSDKWIVYPNADLGVTTIRETGGNLILSQTTSGKFPFVISKNQVFPQGDFSSEIKFQYSQITGYGTGIALTDKDPTQNPLLPELIRIDVWQDRFLNNMRLEFIGQIVFTTSLNTDPHIFRIERKGLKYLVYLDDNLVFTSTDTQVQTKYLWMGNYVTVPPGDWTKFNVDYIRIKDLSKTPLILIPGIGGSELKVSEDTFWSAPDAHGGVYIRGYSKDEKIWVNELEAIKPGHDDYFDVLRMHDDGITSQAKIGLTETLYAGAYQETINFFDENGYTPNQDLFIFPYDWRLDISHTAPLLDQKIQEIKDQTGAEKIDIVAHSMGGLVARNYISDATRAQNVRKLFTLGTPHLGAADFIKFLRYGGCFTKPELQNIPLCIGLEGAEIKDVIQNMIAGFQLAPSQIYFNFYSDEDNAHPYPYRTQAGSLNYLQIKNLLTGFNHNTTLFTPSEAFHTLDNSLSNTNGVEVTIIAGSGQPTLGQIIELTLTTFNGNTINFKDKRNINGDGTVPLLSASISDPHKNLFLNGPAKVYYANQEHGGLVFNGPSLNLVKNILANDNNLPDGVSISPYRMTGHGLSVHSPVNIHVYDANGNHTGPTTDGFEANIQGSSYDTLGDAKFIYLPDEGIYNIRFEATDNGSFDFKIREFENDENTETILYKEIPLTNSTKAETIFNTSSDQPPVIEVDQDGDGNSDFNVENFSILEGDANYDYTPPVISFDVNPKIIWPPNNEMVDINITGILTDDNPYLTTILVEDEYDLIEPSIKTYYQTDINQTIKLEATRNEEDKNGRIYTIRVLTTDLAGNTSQTTFEVIVPHDQKEKK